MAHLNKRQIPKEFQSRSLTLPIYYLPKANEIDMPQMICRIEHFGVAKGGNWKVVMRTAWNYPKHTLDILLFQYFHRLYHSYLEPIEYFKESVWKLPTTLRPIGTVLSYWGKHNQIWLKLFSILKHCWIILIKTKLNPEA